MNELNPCFLTSSKVGTSCKLEFPYGAAVLVYQQNATFMAPWDTPKQCTCWISGSEVSEAFSVPSDSIWSTKVLNNSSFLVPLWTSQVSDKLFRTLLQKSCLVTITFSEAWLSFEETLPRDQINSSFLDYATISAGVMITLTESFIHYKSWIL